MTKEEILEKHKNKEIKSIGEVVSWVNTLTPDVHRPTHLKKGDVYRFGDGYKKRPYVIYKVYKKTVVSIPLTNTQDELATVPVKCRFWGGGYFSKSLLTHKYDLALEYYAGFTENKTALNKAYREIKESMP